MMECKHTNIDKDNISESTAVIIRDEEKSGDPVTERISYHCGVCGYTTVQIRNFEDHLTLHNGKLQCKICGLRFYQHYMFCIHIKTHLSELYSYNVCGAGSSLKPVHEVSKTEPSARIITYDEKTGHQLIQKIHYPCVYCSEDFPRTSELRLHIKQHTGKNPLWCRICTVPFMQELDFQNHFGLHVGKKPFCCEICGLIFSQHCKLCTHIKNYSYGIFSCKVCGVWFDKKDGNTHNISESAAVTVIDDEKGGDPLTGRISYHCKICGYTSVQKADFIKHKHIHISEKPYLCKFCTGTFSKTCDLEGHIRKHRGEKPLWCRICGMEFRQKLDFQSHLALYTGKKPFRCEICGLRFHQHFTLCTHIKSHSSDRYSCEVCGAWFYQKQALKKHRSSHSEKKVYPDICVSSHTKKSILDVYIKQALIDYKYTETSYTTNYSPSVYIKLTFIDHKITEPIRKKKKPRSTPKKVDPVIYALSKPRNFCLGVYIEQALIDYQYAETQKF